MQKEDLAKYDYVVAIDKSGSMNDSVKKGAGGPTRWQAARELVHAVAQEAAKYDDDGITVAVFSNGYKEYVNIDNGVDKVDEIFDKNNPNGTTDTAGVVNHYLQDYISRKAKSPEIKPLILIVVTDGIPDDEDALMSAIVRATKKLATEDEVGIQFLQVGDDAHARAFLKRLDDDLVEKHKAQWDIVDTKNMDELDGISLTDILVEAVND